MGEGAGSSPFIIHTSSFPRSPGCARRRFRIFSCTRPSRVPPAWWHLP